MYACILLPSRLPPVRIPSSRVLCYHPKSSRTRPPPAIKEQNFSRTKKIFRRPNYLLELIQFFVIRCSPSTIPPSSFEQGTKATRQRRSFFTRLCLFHVSTGWLFYGIISCINRVIYDVTYGCRLLHMSLELLGKKNRGCLSFLFSYRST